MDRSLHPSSDRRVEWLGVLLEKRGGKSVFPLFYGNGMAFDLYQTSTEISGDSIFLSVQMHDADDPCEMKTKQRNIRNGKHQGTIVEAALGPDILFGERMPEVSFKVSDPVSKMISRPVDLHLSVYLMAHTVNTVSALHKRDKSENPHNVITDRRKISELKASPNRKPVLLDIQTDTFLTERALSDLDR